jgi:5-methylcytosine-specific restriction endonuclease McrA
VTRPWRGREAQRLTALTLRIKGTVCHLCGQPGATSADHRRPRSKGGTDALTNLEPAHLACNRARSDMDLSEWFARHPLPTRQPLAPSRNW